MNRKHLAELALVLVLALVMMMPGATSAQASSIGAAPPSATHPSISGTPLVVSAGNEAPPNLASTSATRKWLNGTSTYHSYYRACPPEGSQKLTNEYVGYWGTDDASYPKVGDIYYGHVVVGVIGSSCAGGVDISIKVQLPDYTAFLSNTGTVPIKCYYGVIGGTLGDVTADPSASCTQHPTDSGGGWWDLSGRVVANGRLFEIVFPLYSTHELKGLSQGGTQLVAEVDETIALTLASTPNQWVWVGANPPTISYPTPSYLILSGTNARTIGDLNAHFTAGQLYFDLGTTTAYGVSNSGWTIDGAADSYWAFQEWSGFTIGQTYHFRMRFVPSSGSTVYGADQSFVFTGTPSAPTFTLTASAAPSNAGTVTLSPPGGSYAPGTVVSLTATPNTGFKFSGWTVDGVPSGITNPISVTMDKYHSAVANFSPTGTATIQLRLYLPLTIR